MNTVHEEITEGINAEGPKRARKVCEATINSEQSLIYAILTDSESHRDYEWRGT
ncbi:hypothetical protein [Vulcanisaeta sp. EB80]|uniref:hypothetical protein n=1 Tax=Vulcanisaeta sp. EB80 TaxID=1650660 RepID=UPI001389D04D|nr:hypothetical protein [Vulcanisaeta sp. EB80]